MADAFHLQETWNSLLTPVENYLFVEGVPESHYRFNFETSLFNTEAHQLLQKKDGWISFHVLHSVKKTIDASLHFNVENFVARSPYKSPFGSIELSEDLPCDIVFDFIVYVEKALAAKNIDKVIIKTAPLIYHNAETFVQVSLLNLGFEIINAEISSVIEINAGVSENNFHYSEKKRVRKANNKKLEFKILPIEAFHSVFHFIKECRNAKQFPLSMSAEELGSVVARFEEKFQLFGLFDADRLVAASICIRVNSQVLYDFYHDHHKDYNDVSPIAALVDGIRMYCIDRKINLLDLGTSSLEGKPNFGLLTFKSRLGAKASPKFTFEKKLR
jgi:hypothetical protein